MGSRAQLHSLVHLQHWWSGPITVRPRAVPTVWSLSHFRRLRVPLNFLVSTPPRSSQNHDDSSNSIWKLSSDRSMRVPTLHALSPSTLSPLQSPAPPLPRCWISI